MTPKNIEHIHHLISTLAMIPENAEKDFMSLGSFLQSIYTEISDLVTQTSGSAKLLQGDDKNVLDNMSQIADSTIQSLEQIHHMINMNIPPILEIINQLDKLYEIQGGLKYISRYLNAVSFNFMIETSSFHIRNENFSILATEVKDLAKQIHDISTRIKQNTETAQSRFSEAKRIISTRFIQVGKITTKAKKHVLESIEDTRELMDHSVTAIEQSNNSSVLINSQIGNIIVAMQMHDNISQRIEHINQGLEDVIILCSTQNPIGQRTYSEEERSGFAYHILLVQVSQLEDIISDIETVFTENSRAFEKILEEIDRFLAKLFNVNGKNSNTELMAGLTNSLGRINSLKTEGETMISEVEKIASGSLETSEQLSVYVSHVHTVSKESQIKALNAIIAADKLGEHGRPLKILASEMRMTTEKIDGFTNHVDKIIKNITATSKKINSSSSAIKTKKEKKSSRTIDNSIEHSISEISTTHDMVTASMGDIRAKGKHIKAMSCRAIEELAFLKIMIDNLQALLIRLKELKKEFEPFQHVVSSASLAEDSYFSGRYTMEKERIIHKKHLGQKEINSVEIVSEEDDDLGDNIDLF